MNQKTRYLVWAVIHQFGSKSCPACGSEAEKQTVKRKYFVTSLVECPECGLRYRMPRMSEQESDRFYQSDYSQGFTTDLPTDSQLQEWKTDFQGTEKDYGSYIAVLDAMGIQPPSTILDFGCSWGYGSWQLSNLGYRVYSYEISEPRATYAKERLQCNILDRPDDVPEKVDCLFSAHVMEHLPDPSYIVRLSTAVLKPTGHVVAFMPNGDSDVEDTPEYHQHWGLVHPNMMTRRALSYMANKHGFSEMAYTSPYNLEDIHARRLAGRMCGDELLFIARRR
jgi:2-polyprenyl-3-methyl-5-hydroxy-6-metoxy-1,4-benzoquinol methylase